AGEHGEALARDPEREIPEVVLARPANGDVPQAARGERPRRLPGAGVPARALGRREGSGAGRGGHGVRTIAGARRGAHLGPGARPAGAGAGAVTRSAASRPGRGARRASPDRVRRTPRWRRRTASRSGPTTATRRSAAG